MNKGPHFGDARAHFSRLSLALVSVPHLARGDLGPDGIGERDGGSEQHRVAHSVRIGGGVRQRDASAHRKPKHVERLYLRHRHRVEHALEVGGACAPRVLAVASARSTGRAAPAVALRVRYDAAHVLWQPKRSAALEEHRRRAAREAVQADERPAVAGFRPVLQIAKGLARSQGRLPLLEPQRAHRLRLRRRRPLEGVNRSGARRRGRGGRRERSSQHHTCGNTSRADHTEHAVLCGVNICLDG